jgi:hypothetical protein
LYLQRSYKQAQTLALEILLAAGVQLDPLLGDAIATATAAGGALPKNEARDREMLDVAIRCAIKLDDKPTALALAEASRSRVSIFLFRFHHQLFLRLRYSTHHLFISKWTNNPGLGHTAGEAYLFADRPYGICFNHPYSVFSQTD